MTDLKEFNATDYFWNFGDGFNPGGASMKKAFKKTGEYTIQLGLLGEKDSLGLIPKRCVMKNIRIYNGFQELALKEERGEDKESWKTDSPEVQFNTMQVSVYLMDDLSGQQKVRITETLNKSGELTVKFDKYGILDASYPVLDDVAGILKVNPDIRLEITVHATIYDDAARISERRSKELEYYLLNRGIDKDSFGSKGFGLDHQSFRQTDPESKAIDGIIEFIFLKK
jgi:outer membrane protein OmpA-like peptidoglycan-associated protein